MNREKIIKKVIEKVAGIEKIAKTFSIIDLDEFLKEKSLNLKEYSEKKYGNDGEQFVLWLIDSIDKKNLKFEKVAKELISKVEEWKGKDFVKKYLTKSRREDIGLTY